MESFKPYFKPGETVVFPTTKDEVVVGTINYCIFRKNEKRWVYAIDGFAAMFRENQLEKYTEENLKLLSAV